MASNICQALNRGCTRNGGTVKAKVHVPRLDGGSMGALATRTPHRPLPVGLSIGRVVAVDVAAGTVRRCRLTLSNPMLKAIMYDKVTESLRRKRNKNETKTKRKRYRPITGERMRQLGRFRFRFGL